MPATGKTANYQLPLYNGNDSVSELITFNDAMSKIDDIAAGFAADINNTSAAIDELKNADATMANNVKDLTERVEAIEDKVPGYDSNIITVQGIVSELNTAKSDITELQSTTESLQTNIDAVAGDVDTLKTTVADNESKIETAATNIATNTTNITELFERLPFPLAKESDGSKTNYGYIDDEGKFIPFDRAVNWYNIAVAFAATSVANNMVLLNNTAYDAWDRLMIVGSTTQAQSTVTFNISRGGVNLFNSPMSLAFSGVANSRAQISTVILSSNIDVGEKEFRAGDILTFTTALTNATITILGGYVG